MGRFPQPPAYQNGSVVVPQTPAVPKAMQGQTPYGGAEKKNLGGGLSFNFFNFHPLLGEDFQFDDDIFQTGRFNHQVENNEL